MKIPTLKKYKSIPEPVKASVWFVICGFLQKSIAMLTTPIFTRLMTDTEYGRLSVYSSWLNIVQIVVALSLAAGVYTRGLVKNERDQDRFSSSMLGLSTVCLFIWTVIYVVFHKFINSILHLSTFLIISMLIEIWMSEAYTFWANRERVNYQYKKLTALTLAYAILRPVTGIFFVINAKEDYQTEARVLATVCVSLLLFFWIYISILKKGKQFYNKNYWLYGLKFNIPLVPHYLSKIVLNQSDRLMISNICGASFAAYYSVAYTLAGALQILNSSIAASMNPWIYRCIENGKEKEIGKYSNYILYMIAASNFAIIAIAPEMLKVLAPASYTSALWIIPPVTASVYFMFTYDLFATIEYYFEKTNYVMFASVAGAVSNVILNFIFIRKYGFIAAGYTTLVCFILYACLNYFFMKKVCKAHLGDIQIYNVKMIVGIGFALIVASFLMMMLYDHAVIRYLVIAVILTIAIVKRKKCLEIFRAIKRK